MKKEHWDRDKKESGVFDILCVMVLMIVMGVGGYLIGGLFTIAPSDDKEVLAVKESQPLEFDCEKYLPIWYGIWRDRADFDNVSTHKDNVIVLSYLRQEIDNCESSIKERASNDG